MANNGGVVCREEIKFLGLLARTQEKAAKLGNVSKRTFHNKNKTGPNRRKRIDSTTSPEESSSQINSSNEGLNMLATTTTEKRDDDFVYDWRLPKFVETLEKWLRDLEKHPQGPKKDTLNEYQLKVEFLAKVVTRLEAERVQQERVAAAKAAAESRKNSVTGGGGGGASNGGTDMTDGTGVVPISPTSGVAPSLDHVILPHGPASTGEHIAEEIHQKLEGRRQRNARDQLFDGSGDLYGTEFSASGADVRKRYGRYNDEDVTDGGNDLDALMKAHQAAQEKVAEDMLSLTGLLKEQAIAAGEIVRKDTAVMEQSNVLAQKNEDKLKTETERLQERNSSPCRCWIWMLLSIVCFTFIAMVWIMKFFRKRKWNDEL